jgi:hypothetical protein
LLNKPLSFQIAVWNCSTAVKLSFGPRVRNHPAKLRNYFIAKKSAFAGVDTKSVQFASTSWSGVFSNRRVVHFTKIADVLEADS